MLLSPVLGGVEFWIGENKGHGEGSSDNLLLFSSGSKRFRSAAITYQASFYLVCFSAASLVLWSRIRDSVSPALDNLPVPLLPSAHQI